MKRGLRAFVANRGAMVGAVMISVLVVIAVIGPFVSGDPVSTNIQNGLSELGAPLGPSSGAVLGTDQLGRDVWARLVAGAASSLGIAAIATAIALVIGLTVGMVAGYVGGWVDEALMRLVDLVLAFPVLLLAILLAALLRETGLGASGAPVVVTLAVVGWTTVARVVRGKAMVLARSEMALAARAIGASTWRIVSRHLAPNLVGVALVVTALGFAQNLIAEAVLSYLGLGPPAPQPTWGRMLYEGRTYYRTAPHLVLAPGLAIVGAVVAFNLVAEGLRDVFDPKAQSKRGGRR